MSAWKEWQMAVKHGDTEQAEISRREYESECREDAKRERDEYWDDMYDDDCEDE